MEKKQLLLISTNNDFLSGVKSKLNTSFEITSVRNIHAGYTMALGYLPDAILIDITSTGLRYEKSLQNFKSTHFLNKSYLFVFAEKQEEQEISEKIEKYADEILFDCLSYVDICQRIEDTVTEKKCLKNYWKDSFTGLINLLVQPVVLLQNESIVAINDAFKQHFFVSNPEEVKLTDFVDCKNKHKVLEILRNFVRGKHMRASTTTSLIVMNNKMREAKITFSKPDRALSGQLLMMINFTENENFLNDQIGTASVETEKYFEDNNSVETFRFTKREKEIIALLCKGYKTREISEALCISSKTIEKHRSNIIRRTNSDTILESIIYALNHKMIEI